MATSKIVNDIDAVVALIGGSPSPTFIYAADAEANITADNISFPAVFLDKVIEVVGKNAQGGAKILTYKIRMFFGDLAQEFVDTAVNNDIIISAMRTLSLDFLSQFENYLSEYYYWIKDFQLRSAENVYDTVLAGVFLTFSVTSKTVVSTC